MGSRKMRGGMKEINPILKVVVRMGIVIPLFIVIIGVWAYFIMHAAQPVTDDNNLDNAATLETWSPIDSFCNAQRAPQAVANGSVAGVHTGGSVVPPDQDQPCLGGDVRYTCASMDEPDLCNDDKTFDRSGSWCDSPGLSDDGVVEGSIGNLSQHITIQCCKDRLYESNINYIGLIGYMVVTIPIIFLLIEKIFSKFIYRTIPTQGSGSGMFGRITSAGSQFEKLGAYLSSNAKWIIGFMVMMMIIMPLVRFWLVSYKCEDVIGDPLDLCGRACTQSEDCANPSGTGCIVCVNNVCEDPTFTSDDTSIPSANIVMSVCSVRSIIDDLQDSEIDDLYNQFISGGVTDPSSQKTELNHHLADSDNDKEVTSYYYKFYPRQEISVNDTADPFRVRLPNPDTPGYDYLLNNHLLLEDYSLPACADIDNADECGITRNCLWSDSGRCTTPGCDTAASESMCHTNHDCAWSHADSTCVEQTCPGGGKRYKLPGSVQAINTTQILRENDLHNKVIRSGTDYRTTSPEGYPDNSYPCNDVVISASLQEDAQNTTNTSTNIIDSMDSWISHFELKRVECADKQGQCYMEGTPCETKTGIPIPLKNLQHPDPDQYTVALFTDEGCQNALYPCETVDEACDELTVNAKEYMVESPSTGICKHVTWVNNRWQISNTDTDRKMCVPESLTGGGAGTSIPASFSGAKVAPWVASSPSENPVDTKCRAVHRMPRTNVLDDSLSHYYRWSPTNSPGQSLCSTWSGACSGSAILYPQGVYGREGSPEDICCVDPGIETESYSLYATGSVAAGNVGPSTIADIDPTGLCSTWAQGNTCDNGTELKSGVQFYSAGNAASECCENTG